MTQQDEKGQLWQIMLSNLQGRGAPRVTRLRVVQKAFAKRTDERLARLATLAAADAEEAL